MNGSKTATDKVDSANPLFLLHKWLVVDDPYQQIVRAK